MAVASVKYDKNNPEMAADIAAALADMDAIVRMGTATWPDDGTWCAYFSWNDENDGITVTNFSSRPAAKMFLDIVATALEAKGEGEVIRRASNESTTRH